MFYAFVVSKTPNWTAVSKQFSWGLQFTSGGQTTNRIESNRIESDRIGGFLGLFVEEIVEGEIARCSNTSLEAFLF
jgi:hypothetical protein